MSLPRSRNQNKLSIYRLANFNVSCKPKWGRHRRGLTDVTSSGLGKTPQVRDIECAGTAEIALLYQRSTGCFFFPEFTERVSVNGSQHLCLYQVAFVWLWCLGWLVYCPFTYFGCKGKSCPSALIEHHAMMAHWGVEV